MYNVYYSAESVFSLCEGQLEWGATVEISRLYGKYF
jgi:hypothetical protein